MKINTKGVVHSIEEVDATKDKGTALVKIGFIPETDDYPIYPALLGTKVSLIRGIEVGDTLDLHMSLRGQISKSGTKHCNVVIDRIVKL